MKFSVGVFCTVIVVAYFGSTLANKEGSDDADCPLKQITGRRSPFKILEELIRIEARCLNETIDLDMSRLQRFKDIEEHREFFRGLCHGRTATRECFDAEYTKWTECYNETMGGVFTIFADFLNSSLDKGCVDEGKGLALITDGFQRFTADYNARNPFVRECIIFGSTRLMMVLDSPANIATKIWFLHGALRHFQECFAEHVPEESPVRFSVMRMGEVLDEMKCIHPVDEELVLCKSVDGSLIDRASACPIRRRNEVALPLSAFLERRLFNCFLVYEPYGVKLSDAATPEEFADYFNNYCRRNVRVTRCLDETTLAARVCLHEPEFKNFKLDAEYLRGVLEAGCSEQGRRLASFFHTANTLRNNTEGRDGLLSCLSTVQTANALSVDDPTRLLRVYRELPVVRRCFVEQASGNTAFVEDVNGFIGDVMDAMKCVDARNGNVVLCNTLEPSDSDSSS